MAYYDKERGIVLHEAEKELFKETGYLINARSRTPISDRIMDWILPKELQDNNKKDEI